MRWIALAVVALTWGCGPKDAPPAPKNAKKTAPKAAAKPTEATELVLYAGRSMSLVKPLVARFEKSSGIKVKVRDAKSGKLAALLLEEKGATKADLFWSQDAGALGQIEKAGLLATLPKDVGQGLLPVFTALSAHWVPTSGRARVLAHSTKLAADALPKSVFELSDPKWKGKVGWAPTNASFQAFVTAMRASQGEEKTEAWLKGMQANEAQRYPKNTPIIAALANAEIELGLPNHYYLLRARKKDPKTPVAQVFFAPGDIGNLMNVAGVALLKSSKRREAALKFVRFLLSKESQAYFTGEIFEYPVLTGVKAHADLVALDSLAGIAPKVDLKTLADLKGTRALLRKVGLL